MLYVLCVVVCGNSRETTATVRSTSGYPSFHKNTMPDESIRVLQTVLFTRWCSQVEHAGGRHKHKAPVSVATTVTTVARVAGE